MKMKNNYVYTNDKLNKVFFYLLFMICNFNAVLSIFIPRTVYTIAYIFVLFVSLFFWGKQSQFKFSSSELRRDGFVIIFIFICVLRYAIQMIYGDVTSLSFQRLFQTIIPVLIYFAAIKLDARNSEDLEMFFVNCAAISVALGLLNQLVEIIPASYFSNEMSYVGKMAVSRSYSMAGLSLGTGVICGISFGFILKNSKVIKKKFFFIYMLIFAISVIKTFSRGGVFFSLIVFSMFGLLSVIWSKNNLSKRTVISISLAIVLFSLLIIVYGDKIQESVFYKKYFVYGFDKQGSIRSSFQMRAINLIRKYPLLGRGFGFVGSNAYIYSIGEGFPPENNYFQMAIECGLIATILYFGFVIKIIIANLKSKESEKKALIGIILGFLAWSVMSTPIEGDINAAVFWYCLARLSVKDDMLKSDEIMN